MHAQQVKTVGHNGQLYLGKDFADKMVLIDRLGEHTLIIKTGEFQPHAEAWLTPAALKKIDTALEWQATHQPKDNAAKVIAMLETKIHAKHKA